VERYVAGKLFVLLPLELELVIVGLATDIYFSVLSFNNALGTPIMCAGMIKSDCNIAKNHIFWKLGDKICTSF
jgi:hypothetical protein